MLHIRTTVATPIIGVQEIDGVVYLKGSQTIIVPQPCRRYLIADTLGMAGIKLSLLDNGIKIDDEYHCEPPHHEDESDDEIIIYRGIDDVIVDDQDNRRTYKASDGSLFDLLYNYEHEIFDPKEQYL